MPTEDHIRLVATKAEFSAKCLHQKDILVDKIVWLFLSGIFTCNDDLDVQGKRPKIVSRVL